jgi:AbiV family abortive infection protein
MDIYAKSSDNAKEYFELAQSLARQNKWGHAYGMLVFCIEEWAKSKLCMYHAMVLDAKKHSPDGLGGLEFTERKIKELFTNHKSKRITVLTQLILYLADAYNPESKKKILLALTKNDITLFPEIERVLRIYCKIPILRDRALYVEPNGHSPTDITKGEYEELFGLVKLEIKRGGSLRFCRCMTYEELENNVHRLLDNYEGKKKVL